MPKSKGYFYVYILATLFVLTGISVSAQKSSMTVAELALYKGADRQQILEEGARKEGRLVYYTTEILKQTLRPKVDAFQKKYPYIKVEIWRAGTEALVPRALEEYAAGKHTADLLGVTQEGGIVMREKGILQPFYSPNLFYIEEGAISKAPDEGAFSAGHYENGHGLGYNTKLINREQVPKTYQDLLNPKWKGKVAIAGSNTGVNWMGAMFLTYGEEFVKKVAQQNFDVHMVSARAILDMIINGEYIFSPTTTDAHVIKSRQEGAAVDWVPLEPVPAYIGQIALYKHSPHPYAALLFIDFDLSKEVGELYKANGYNSTRKDLSGEKTYKKFYGARSTKEALEWDELFKRLFLKK